MKNWIRRYVPFTQDRYEEVKFIKPRLVEAIVAFYVSKPARFIVAGHSLCSGLTQQAAYISDRIKEVYAFDSSSVTGYQTTPNPPRDTNVKGICLYCFHEKGEIFAPERTLFFMCSNIALKSQTPILTTFCTSCWCGRG